MHVIHIANAPCQLGTVISVLAHGSAARSSTAEGRM
jgi:hypothetical protein